jgi:hypothetical protein
VIFDRHFGANLPLNQIFEVNGRPASEIKPIGAMRL